MRLVHVFDKHTYTR